MLFTEFPLDDRLQRALATAGFVSPTPIQAEALPVALAGRDLVGTAQTGTGKTAAFVLPILQRLIARPSNMRNTRALILAPTRELVEQIYAVVQELGLHTNVRASTVYGGVAMLRQTRALRNGVELVIACPGRLLDHIHRGNTYLRQVDCLVLDEADRMLDMGFLPSIQEIIDDLPVCRQTLLFSATFAGTLDTFVQQTLRDPVRVEVDTAVPAQTVRHTLYHVESKMKITILTSLLRQLLPDSEAVLIFTNTRLAANKVARHLQEAGLHADVLHAEKTQRARQQTLDQFRAGEYPYLVATDIAARGLDVTTISHVINYDLPPRADDYLHRIGRTGRMERSGHAISLMSRGDGRALREIEHMLGHKIEIARLESNDEQPRNDIQSSHDQPARPTQPAEQPPRAHKMARPSQAAEQPMRAHKMAHPSQPAEQPLRAHKVKRPSPAADSSPHAADAPPRKERPRRAPQTGAANAAPAHAARPAKRQAATAPSAEQRPPRRRHEETTSAPKRRDRAADNRFADASTSGTTRPERPHRKPFTGMASNYHRKPAPGKRKPGEVASGPRPRGK